jgi:MFS family permease
MYVDLTKLPETKQFSKAEKKTKAKVAPVSKHSLAALGWLHFIFLFVFSGMEFTLTFLTFDRFKFTNQSQGLVLAFIGISSAFIQGGYVRRVSNKSESSLVLQGVIACSIGLFTLGVYATNIYWLYFGAFFLSFTSGTVVTSLTSLASSCGTDQSKDRGAVLGKFRALGQLGRSMGPIVACTGYWILGSTRVYALAGSLMAVIAVVVQFTINSKEVSAAKVKKQ